MPSTAIDILRDVPWLRLGAYLFLSTFVLGNLATWLRNRNNWPDGYSRKINHFGHMLISTPLLAFLPPRQLIPSVIIGAVLVIAIYAVAAASSRPLVHGIVAGSLRRRDAPRSRFFFFLPLVTGNLALMASAMLFPLDLVRVAFFTAAFADGFAEPVGLRFGSNNAYGVRDPIWKGRNSKSLAGSGSVFAWSLLIALVATILGRGFGVMAILVSILYAACVTLIEAVSPRGLDNMLLLSLCPVVMWTLNWSAW